MAKNRWTASAWLDVNPGGIVVQLTNFDGPSVDLSAAVQEGLVTSAIVEDLKPGETRRIRLDVGPWDVRSVVVSDGSDEARRVEVIA